MRANSFLVSADNQASCWFPCVQSASECCTWKLEVTCDEELAVVASGALIETEIVGEGVGESGSSSGRLSCGVRRRRFHFYVGQPTCAGNIGLAVGRFDSVPDANMAEVYFMARGYCFFVFFSGRYADKIEVFLSY